MDPRLQQLESALGVPADLLLRSAAARASESGGVADVIIAGWAGEDPSEMAPPAATQAAVSATVPAVALKPAEVSEVEVEVLEATEEPAAGVPLSEEVDEGPLGGFPAWLAAALVLIPAVALFYVLIAPHGPGCGSSGQLAIDAETGLAESCDGTEYGVEVVNVFTVGRDVYLGAGKCTACHGDSGEGGTGPALSGGAVLATFPGGACSDHISWVSIGTDDWSEPTYGALGAVPGASGAAMPGFGDTLTSEEIAAVAVYERVMFGGESLQDAESDCGSLTAAAGE